MVGFVLYIVKNVVEVKYKMDINEWQKNFKVGIFLGDDTLTPVKFLHDSEGTGEIRWKYFGPFKRERVLKNIPLAVLGQKYYMYTNDKKEAREVQIFHMNINGKPCLTHLPPSIIRETEILRNNQAGLIATNASLRKMLFDKANKDAVMKEAVRIAGFRKEVIDAGQSGAEQFGGGGGFFNRPSYFGSSSLGTQPIRRF